MREAAREHGDRKLSRRDRRLIRALAFLAALFAFAPLAHAGPLSGEWTGSYVCTQGETALSLTIADAENDLPFGDIVADFRFSALPQNPDVPSGRLSMRGHFDAATGAVTLYGEAWRERPASYEMVNLFGRLSRAADGDAISGRVGFPVAPELCTVFRVTRPPPRAFPERVRGCEGAAGARYGSHSALRGHP